MKLNGTGSVNKQVKHESSPCGRIQGELSSKEEK